MNIDTYLSDRKKDDQEDEYLIPSPSKFKPSQPMGNNKQSISRMHGYIDKSIKFIFNMRSNGLIVFCLTCSFALFVIIVFRYSKWWLGEIDKATYMWQMTTLSPQIQPPKQKSCNFNHSDDGSSGIYSYTRRSLSIGMVYVFGKSESNSSWSASFINRTLENRWRYCQRYGYTLLDGTSFIDSRRPIAWSKLLAVRHYLPHYDYILYIDMDTVIMNFQRRLEDFIGSSSKDIIMTSDWNGPNTGTAVI
jgi:hypothetical protein